MSESDPSVTEARETVKAEDVREWPEDGVLQLAIGKMERLMEIGRARSVCVSYAEARALIACAGRVTALERQRRTPDEYGYWSRALSLLADEMRVLTIERLEDKRDKMVAILVNAAEVYNRPAADSHVKAPALVRYMTAESAPERAAAFLETLAERVRNGTAWSWEIPNTVALTLEDTADLLLRESLKAQQLEEEAEKRVIKHVLAHWFTQGAENQFGDLGQPHNADALVASILSRLRDHLQQSQEEREKLPACAHCGKPATCFGVYENPEGPIGFACDDCCGHGNEDGWCRAVNHDADFCGCGNHALFCPYNLQATEVTPLPYRVTDFYRVEVSDQHGQVVAIEPEMLSGRDIGARERFAIQAAIDRLCAFSGLSPSVGEPQSVESRTVASCDVALNAPRAESIDDRKAQLSAAEATIEQLTREIEGLKGREREHGDDSRVFGTHIREAWAALTSRERRSPDEPTR